ncbi:PhoPQ-activated protein PqaA family protein [Chitinimonas sp. BJB300]|uniref:PhoPQ-activated protein PqaA family protein n=1 Tax=Chitinimonas sp. BJB300 TaxID=1559339 RepID=UPI0013044033|nr:PhoPQ-activated protein PqaA family protein [Chitinimonas sp. BJB300]
MKLAIRKPLARSLFGIGALTLLSACISNNPPVHSEQGIVRDYFAAAAPTAKPAELIDESLDGQVQTRRYRFVSQTWPRNFSTLTSDTPQWQHELRIYRPKNLRANAPTLLYINSGINLPTPDDIKGKPVDFPGKVLANKLGIVVADLYFVPNQQLSLDGRPPGREDDLVAFTWRRFIDAPETERFSSLHLPMAQAVREAMNVVQQQQTQGTASFVLAGASKRGWTAWLTGLNDERVKAVVPIVADFWNVKENFTHVYRSYGNEWPVALRNYVDNKVVDDILASTPALDRLTAFEDVVNYPTQMARLDKYMISAAGDDFAVPDSAWAYLPKFTGTTLVRYLPNQSHAINGALVLENMGKYLTHTLEGQRTPRVTVSSDPASGMVTLETDTQATNARAWVAINPTKRDFRLRSNINYQQHEVSGGCNANGCRFSYQPDPSQTGWQSYFIELESEGLPLTSPPLIWPRTYPGGQPVPLNYGTLTLSQGSAATHTK